jgi:hypothetical protein
MTDLPVLPTHSSIVPGGAPTVARPTASRCLPAIFSAGPLVPHRFRLGAWEFPSCRTSAAPARPFVLVTSAASRS